MDVLPIELVKLISYYLSPCKLAVNNTYNNIYDEYWYQKYLEDRYPNYTLWKRSTYKDLCIKEYKSGIVNEWSILKLGYVALEYLSKNVDVRKNQIEMMVLRFNGDLYVGRKYIRSNVLAIDSNYFITENELFFVDSNYNISLLVKPRNSKFIAMGYDPPEKLYGLTNIFLYVYDCDEDKIKRKIEFNDAVDMCIGEEILVLERNGNVYKIDRFSSEKKLLYLNGVKLLGNAVLLSTSEIVIPLLIDRNNKINFQIPFKCEKVINYSNRLYILSDYKVYIYDYHNNRIIETIDNVKDITGNYVGIYLIR